MSFRVLPAVECGDVIAVHANGGPYRRPRPVIAGPRPEGLSRGLLRHMFEQVEPPSARVVRFANATVRGPGIITLPDGIIVGESLINSSGIDPVGDLRRTGPDSFAPVPPFASATASPPGPHVLLKQLWDMNYGHWLIEGLPRMALLEGLPGQEDWRFLISSPEGMSPLAAPMRRVMADSLHYFGIPRERITLSGWSPQFFAELIYPLPLTIHPWIKAPLAIEVLEALGRRVTGAAGPTRLFVRRPPTSRRRLLNEPAAAAMLAARGYVPVMPGEQDFAAQVSGFAGAQVVVGTLGAECANLVFAPRGVRFVGLAPGGMQDDFFYDLVGLKHGAYFGLHGAAEAEGMNADFSVDLEQLHHMVAAAEALCPAPHCP